MCTNVCTTEYMSDSSNKTLLILKDTTAWQVMEDCHPKYADHLQPTRVLSMAFVNSKGLQLSSLSILLCSTDGCPDKGSTTGRFPQVRYVLRSAQTPSGGEDWSRGKQARQLQWTVTVTIDREEPGDPRIVAEVLGVGGFLLPASAKMATASDPMGDRRGHFALSPAG